MYIHIYVMHSALYKYKYKGNICRVTLGRAPPHNTHSVGNISMSSFPKRISVIPKR